LLHWFSGRNLDRLTAVGSEFNTGPLGNKEGPDRKPHQAQAA